VAPAAASPAAGGAGIAAAAGGAPCSVGVSTAGALAAALQKAKPGQVLCLAPGTYRGQFVATVSGSADARIVLDGPADAVLDGGSVNTGYALYLNGASYWDVRGITVTNAKKGIMLDRATNVAIDGVTVRRIGEEGIHLRTNSTDNVVQNSTVSDTGLVTPAFGEGVYIGSAQSNWCTYTACQPDRSDRNVVRDNHLGPNVRAECVDVKEGTTGGVIAGNALDATGIAGANAADSWIDVKGNGYAVTGNIGVNPTGTTILKDGFQVHVAAPGWGNGNRFAGNVLDVRSTGHGIWVQATAQDTTVFADNTVTNAAAGTANVPLTPCPCP
jgi:hypothetical protein